MTPDSSRVRDRLDSMNAHYGRGTIVSVKFQGDFKSGTVQRSIAISQHGRNYETRKFRIIGTTIHFLGHQSNYVLPIRL